MNDPDFQKALAEENRRDQIAHSTLGSILSMILMPLGTFMDYKQYGTDLAVLFLKLRLASSLIVGLAWLWFHVTGRKHYRIFGVMWYVAPTVFILWMIRVAPDPAIPYYAGLNLVLLALGLLSAWTYVQNFFSAIIIITLFLLASLLNPTQQKTGAIYNNLFFLISTATIVIAGSYASYRQRLREFQLRWELDKNRVQLEENNQKLKELDRIKSQFFANISHELRTPLTLLLAPLENLLQRRNWDHVAKDMLLTMQSNGMRLLKSINDLLELVRLESGRLVIKREPLAIKDFLNGLASAARQGAEQKGLRLETEIQSDLGTILLDKDKTEKIVLNLLFNAIKFTPKGGEVVLKAVRDGLLLQIRVTDNGIGIAPEQLPHIFDRFWQGDASMQRKYTGVGIGLSLVKELAEGQSGAVRVESVRGKGSTFIVSLPYTSAEVTPTARATAPAEESATEPQGGQSTSEEWLASLYRRAEFFPSLLSSQENTKQLKSSSNGRGHKVLVADDEPDMLHFLETQLTSDYEVLTAVNGQEAVDKACEMLPHLIVLDMMMPQKDGLQVCRELRERPLTQSIPILLLTAKADEQTKLDALSAGANDFLAKPFSTTELNVRINNLVESYAYQRKLAKQNVVLESTIEQLKDTETQLVQTEKMASLGRMSAGIIHEINNPLNFAATGLFTLRKKSAHLDAADRQEYNEVINDVEEGLNRVKNIVLDLRTFTRPDNETTEQVDLVLVVASALRFLSAEWKNTVRIEQRMPEHVYVAGNRNKLIQVMLNLLQNSLDALKSKNFTDEKPTIWVEGEVENNRSILTVRDNGQGIKPEHQDKIFDPFFTTKDVGKGMGLGLSICYRLLEQVNARISVRSEHGKFCEFRLEFPRKIPA